MCHHGEHHHGHHHSQGCGCVEGHPEGNCGCGGGCCGGGDHFQRRYQTKAEQISELEAYLGNLKLEVQAVEEQFADFCHRQLYAMNRQLIEIPSVTFVLQYM